MDLQGVTQELLASIKPEMMKALEQGFNVDLGLQGYELEAPSKSLFPVLSPFRNRIPRVKAPVGSLASNWKAITKINAANSSPFVGFGYAGPQVETQTAEFNAAYKPLALDDQVIQDAQMLARGFQDLRATAGINLLYALMISEDQMLLGAQNFALQAPAAPTLTVGSGGNLADDIVVSVSARTLENYFAGGTSLASPEASTSTITTGGKVTATVPAVRGAVAYDWYVGSDTPTGPFYFGTTTVNTVVISDIPTSNNALSALPELAAFTAYATVKNSSGADKSADPNAFNGLLATLAGDSLAGTQVTHLTGGAAASGAYFKSLDGGTFTGVGGSVTELDDALLSLWNNARISPTLMLTNAQQHIDITNAVIKSGGAITLFPPDQVSPRQNFVGGALLENYLNKAVNGRPIPIETHPHIPDGTVVLVSEVLPYPNNSVANVFEVETQQEYTQFEYAMARGSGAAGGPRYDIEVRAIEVFKNYFPAGCAVVQNIGHGFTAT